MPDERPLRRDADPGVDLRFAAMVATHEQRKWTVVHEVIRVLDQLRTIADAELRDEPTDPRAAG
jgi:hypothetical protein